MENIDIAWENFINNRYSNQIEDIDLQINKNIIPKCNKVYISTKTMIGYLNQSIPLNSTFWFIKLIPYHLQKEGVLKKQIKINNDSQEGVTQLLKKIKKIDNPVVSVDILKQLRGKKGAFKDSRKISIGLSKKDLISYKKKKCGAFYNCFVVILRIWMENNFHEIHVKIFNTGKLEIPGIQKNEYLYRALDILINSIQPIMPKKLEYDKQKIETVLINSNFNCGYYINREKFYNILKYNYYLNVQYDSCSYPGIQCKFYYNQDNKANNGICSCKKKCNKKGTGKGEGKCQEISFMIFRTGSILIVGHCEEHVIYIIYKFLKKILYNEYYNIHIKNNNTISHKKKRKIKKKVIIKINS